LKNVEKHVFQKSKPVNDIDKKREQKNKRLYNTYGITIEEYEQKAHEGCEVCNRKGVVLCVDHIHVAGFKKMPPEEKKKYVRGIACFMCNTGFKSFEKTKDGERNRQSLEGTYRYFTKYKLKGEL
jgi:hypothetical protein